MHNAKLEPVFVSIEDAATYRAESTWRIKQLLRNGVLKAKKSGRRTLVTFASLKASIANLPDAEFLAPLPKSKSIKRAR
jgi:hypothetical protein